MSDLGDMLRAAAQKAIRPAPAVGPVCVVSRDLVTHWADRADALALLCQQQVAEARRQLAEAQQAPEPAPEGESAAERLSVAIGSTRQRDIDMSTVDVWYALSKQAVAYQQRLREERDTLREDG